MRPSPPKPTQTNFVPGLVDPHHPPPNAPNCPLSTPRCPVTLLTSAHRLTSVSLLLYLSRSQAWPLAPSSPALSNTPHSVPLFPPRSPLGPDFMTTTDAGARSAYGRTQYTACKRRASRYRNYNGVGRTARVNSQRKRRNRSWIYGLPFQSLLATAPLTIGLVNWCSVTPLPIAAVLLTPPVTVMSRLSTNSAPDHWRESTEEGMCQPAVRNSNRGREKGILSDASGHRNRCRARGAG